MKELLINYFTNKGAENKIAGLLADIAITLAILVICIIVHLILKKIVLRIVTKIIKRNKLEWDDVFLEQSLFTEQFL